MVERRFEGKYKFWQWLTVAIFAVLTVRLMTLQLVEAPVYRTQARLNQFRFLPIRAPRGDIVDSNGKVLAANKIVNTVSIVRQQIDEKELDRTINNLAGLLHDVYPEIDAAYIRKLLEEHQSRSYEPVAIKRNVPMEIVSRLEEHRRDLRGVVISKEIVRYYPEGTLASHVLGYIGEISKEELENQQNEDYKAGDLIGRFGLEKQYEKYLRGVDGFQQVEVDVSGRPIPHSDLITVSPKQGDRLVLTLDADLQKVLETSIDQTLAELRKKGLPGRAGAAVVLDVRTGAVLAMASRPAFDPNLLVPPVSDKAAREYLNPPVGADPPMINRAISSKYPPGSTFKPITGMAALESGKITTKETIKCTGRYWLPPYTKCWRVHGAVDFFRAMAVSCNVYFIEAGRRAGVEMITKVAHEFGLDEKTGIDLPGEVPGSFLTPEKKEERYGPAVDKWYREKKAELEKKYDEKLAQAKTERERNDILIQKKYAERDLQNWYRSKYNQDAKWQPYDTYFMAFGQGSNEYTPIGLANYVATLANGGNRMRPYLVQRIEIPSGKVIASFGPQVVHRVDISSETLDTVKKAMREVAGGEGGTAAWLFSDFPFEVAAKTGTAESGRGDNLYHGVFVAFAPADNPQIAFAGIIESGYHGSESMGPVARDVFKEYFGLNKSQQPQKSGEQQTATGSGNNSVESQHSSQTTGGQPSSVTGSQPAGATAPVQTQQQAPGTGTLPGSGQSPEHPHSGDQQPPGTMPSGSEEGAAQSPG